LQVRTEAVRGEAHNSHDRAPRRFASGRQCAEPGCATRLSVYNESDYCLLHKVELAPRVRGNKRVGPPERGA